MFKFKPKYLFLILPLLPILILDSGLVGWVAVLSGFILLYKLSDIVEGFGKKIFVLDLIEFLFILQCLFAPSLIYLFHKYQLINLKWWYPKMKVEAELYYSLAIPCSIGLWAGLHLINRKGKPDLNSIIEKIKKFPEYNRRTGVILLIVGSISSFLIGIAPVEIAFFLTLMSYCMFIGILYLYFSDFKNKALILFLFFAYIIYISISGGMFAILIWWPLMVLMVAFIGKRIPNIIKVSFLFLLIVSFSLLQSVKGKYRMITWQGVQKSKYVDASNADVLQELLLSQVEKEGFQIFNWGFYYPIISRFNQGYHISNAMKYTPRVEPFAYGETIFGSLLATFVPRVFWSDKKIAGGKENYLRFTGIKLRQGTSMNIGQMGDAYVNFTIIGAPLFLFLYGLLLASYEKLIFKRAIRSPTFLLWTPLLSIGLLNVENDFFTTFNYGVKAFIFVFVIFEILKTKQSV